MDQSALRDRVSEAAERLAVPGVSVGVYHGGVEHYAFHGVTNVENPLPVEENTLFQIGSSTKTFTATAVLRLVEEGRVDLETPVREYVPELRLTDEYVAANVTVSRLLNHTAGWAGDLLDSSAGDGDDALARYVERMATLRQEIPLGSAVSYNNAAFSLAGRLVERVTGTTYEQAVRDLVLTPLGLEQSYFFPKEIMTRRFAAGHALQPDGSVAVSRSWALARSAHPAGGIAATAGDQVAWLRFHLGDGTAADGGRVLSPELLASMRRPTAHMPGSDLGDHVGIGWLLRDVDGVRIVGHGGSTVGQHSDLFMVPEHDFGVAVHTNSTPNGPELLAELREFLLAEYIGVTEADPEPTSLSESVLADYVGTYDTHAMLCRITVDNGRLLAHSEFKPEVLAELGADPAEQAQPPIPLAPLGDDGDRYVVPDGPAKGMKGFFSRGADNTVTGIHLTGRMATRISDDPSRT